MRRWMKMPEKGEEMKIKILSEREFFRIRPDGTREKVIVVTYKAPNLPPRTIIVPAGPDQDRRIHDAIKEDIAKIKARTGREITIKF